MGTDLGWSCRVEGLRSLRGVFGWPATITLAGAPAPNIRKAHPAPRAVGSELETLVGMRLGLDAKGKELRQAYGVLAVVVTRAATDPTLPI